MFTCILLKSKDWGLAYRIEYICFIQFVNAYQKNDNKKKINNNNNNNNNNKDDLSILNALADLIKKNCLCM